jgi:hypothetical protein
MTTVWSSYEVVRTALNIVSSSRTLMWIFAEWEDQTPDRVLSSTSWIPQSYVDAPVHMIKVGGWGHRGPHRLLEGGAIAGAVAAARSTVLSVSRPWAVLLGTV